jgi:uncharacterized tellurite resistance protein B-like protein
MGLLRRKPRDRYEGLDKLEAEIARLKETGLDARTLESFAEHLKKAMYSEDRLSRKTMVEVIKTGDESMIAEMTGLLEKMKDAKVHPKELRALHDRAKAFNKMKARRQV